MLDEETLRVTAIQRLCVNDGTGVRTVVFLKGCYLHCPWCCNPETIHTKGELVYDKGKCRKDNLCQFCKGCEVQGGTNKREECPIGAFERTYTEYSIDELYRQIVRDKDVFTDGGGVTFSGGEPLLQAKPLAKLLQVLKRELINVCLETTLYASTENFSCVWKYVDYWIVDLKFQFGYIPNKEYSVPSSAFKQNLECLQKAVPKVPICYRMVLMEEMNNVIYRVFERLSAHNVENIEYLSYHKLAKNKYRQLGMAFHEFTPPTDKMVEDIKSVAMEHNINVNFLRI